MNTAIAFDPETTMDYSTISNDPDHPAAPSPWGSPGADRTTFPTSVNSETPASPLPSRDILGESEERIQGAVAQSPDLSAQLQNTQIGDSDYPGGQSPFAAQQSPNAEQQRSPAQVPARYHTGLRRPSRPPAPVYRIQGKITGLERTGKKDPVLRFDVHVGRPS